MPGSQSDILDFILAQLERVKKCGSYYKARCPSHGDKEASLSLTPMSDGGIRLKCFAGCDHRSICAALNITPQEITGKQSHTNGNAQQWTYYDYVDENGNLLYQRVRIPKGPKDKTFLWCRADGRGGKIFTINKGWFRTDDKKWTRIECDNDPQVKPEPGAIWFDDSRRVLYRADVLAAVRNASQQGKPLLVLVVEGEKDAHTAEIYDFIATTSGSPGDWRSEFGDDLRYLDVVIISDNDDTGREYESQVATDCKGKAYRIRILRLPGLKEKGDLTDWFEAGGTKKELEKLISQAPDYAEILLSNRIYSTPTDDDESDPVLSTDPKTETQLRAYAMHAGDVIDAIWLLFRMLGVKGDHSRLINALLALASDVDWRKKQRDQKLQAYVNLGIIKAFHQNLHVEYETDFPDWKGDPDKAKSDRVSRDIRKFREECIKAGVGHRIRRGWFGLMDYWQGAPKTEDSKAIPSQYRLNFLLFVLLILDREREIGGKNRRKAREQAAQEVALEVMAWVQDRIAKLGEQQQTIEDKADLDADPLKALDSKREAAVKACRSYAQLLGRDAQKIESALLSIKEEAIETISVNGDSCPSSDDITIFAFSANDRRNRAIASELEAEQDLKSVARQFRQSWQDQGFGLSDALKRAPVLLSVFLGLLFAGTDFKRKKRKNLLFQLAYKSLCSLFDKNVAYSEVENQADFDAEDDGMNIVVEDGFQPTASIPVTDPVVEDDQIIQAVIAEDTPAEPVTAAPSPLTLVDTSPSIDIVEFPPEAKGPNREQITDRGYRGPCLWLAHDGDIPCMTVSYAGQKGGAHWINLLRMGESGSVFAAPLSQLYYPDENFVADAELIERWRKARMN